MDYFKIVGQQAKSEKLLFKLEPARLKRLRELAEAADLSMSEWIRRAIDHAPESPASADSRG